MTPWEATSHLEDPLTRGVLPRRLAAAVVDAAVLALLSGLAWLLLTALGILTLGLGFHLLALLPVIPFAYHLTFIAGRSGATPGQSALGLAVRRNDDLGRPTLWQAFVWTLGFYLTVAAGVIWFAAALLTTRRRTLHDLASGLVVLRTRALTGGAGFWNMPPGRPRS